MRLLSRKYISKISVQLKSVYSKNNYSEDENYIYYDLKVKNYNDLRSDRSNPIILGLLILPEEESTWVHNDIDRLLIKKCMYWLYLKGFIDTNNTTTVRIPIPKQSILTPVSLIKILQDVAEGKML